MATHTQVEPTDSAAGMASGAPKRRRYWQPKELLALRKLYRGKNPDPREVILLAAELGRPVFMLMHKAHKLGLTEWRRYRG